VQDFSLLHSVKTDPGAHPFSYSVGIGAFPREAERQGRISDRSSPRSGEKSGAVLPFPTRLHDIVLH
jgi:hypothetical protein